MAKFQEIKTQLLASVLITACLLLNFAVARQNIGLMSLLAQNDYDLVNTRSIAIAMTLCGFVFSSITVLFWQRGMIIPAIIAGVFTVGVFVYECHGVIAAFSELNAKYEENSDTAKLEKMRLELAEKKLKILEVGKVDSSDTESRLVDLQKQVIAKEERAKKCGMFQFQCKNKALAGSDQLAAEIDGLHKKLDHQSDYVAALSEAQAEIKTTDNSENKKTFAVFQTLSRFFYDSIDYAKNLQSKMLVYMGVLIVLLAQSSLAIGLLLLPKAQPINDDLQPTGNDGGNTRRRFLDLVHNARETLSSRPNQTTATTARTEPSMTFLRTGTDNEPLPDPATPTQTRGYGEVVNFPQRNGNASVANPAQNGNASVANLGENPSVARLSTGNAFVAYITDTVIKQASLGRLICENCNANVAKKRINQRFCCDDCRTANWKKTHGKSVKKGRAVS